MDGSTEETMIVGIAAAARYLGYGKSDSFRTTCSGVCLCLAATLM